MNTVGRQNSETAVRKYIKNQGKEKNTDSCTKIN